ncbi:MAG: TonB-dependent receptor, partial [Pseudohongiellaceae bacterium]
TYGAESRFQQNSMLANNQEHRLQWGVRYERHFLNDMRSAGEAGQILTESRRGARTRDDAYQAAAVSAFFQDEIRLENWTVIPGVRAEHYTQNKVRRALPLNPGPHDPIAKDDNTLLLPSLSLLYEGSDNTQVFANIARGYTPAFARTADSFPLDPETGVNTQIGIRSTLSTGFSLEGALFFNDIEDTIVQLPYTVNGINVVLNSADSESWGLDLGLRYDSAALLEAPFNFFTELAYNYTRAEFSEDHLQSGIKGNRVPEIPLHAATLTFGLEHNAGLHLSATISHFGDFYTDPLNTSVLTLADEDREPVEPGDSLEIREPAVLGRVPSHTLVSARLSYAIPDTDITVWLQGRNLTDRLFITDLENGIRPGAERTVVGGVRFTF